MKQDDLTLLAAVGVALCCGLPVLTEIERGEVHG